MSSNKPPPPPPSVPFSRTKSPDVASNDAVVAVVVEVSVVVEVGISVMTGGGAVSGIIGGGSVGATGTAESIDGVTLSEMVTTGIPPNKSSSSEAGTIVVVAPFPMREFMRSSFVDMISYRLYFDVFYRLIFKYTMYGVWGMGNDAR